MTRCIDHAHAAAEASATASRAVLKKAHAPRSCKSGQTGMCTRCNAGQRCVIITRQVLSACWVHAAAPSAGAPCCARCADRSAAARHRRALLRTPSRLCETRSCRAQPPRCPPAVHAAPRTLHRRRACSSVAARRRGLLRALRLPLCHIGARPALQLLSRKS